MCVHVHAWVFKARYRPTIVAHGVFALFRFIGELDRAQELDGATVFERKVVRTGEKRKREAKGDPGVIDGYMGK